jgi:hypothetical protein
MLEILTENSGVFIQKPMGSNLHESTKILEICNTRLQKAALNSTYICSNDDSFKGCHQLRFIR